MNDINITLMKRSARELAKIAELWTHMLKEGLLIENLDAEMAEPAATIVEEIRSFFFVMAKQRLAEVWGVPEVFNALITGSLPEFPGTPDTTEEPEE